MRFNSFLSALPVAPFLGFQESVNASNIVDLGYAKYRGFFDATNNVTSFLGIRYAASPVGALRWKAPQNPDVISEVQDANTQPSQCFWGSGRLNYTVPAVSSNVTSETQSTATQEAVYSEDCLFLNVFTPASVSSSTTSLPVVVWIHGGGYGVGSASIFPNGDLVRKADYGVISVVIQYRLGIFGFLSSEAVKQNGTLNTGLVDQDFALHWVQDHIAKFGGDPSRVTIWGQSAGAGSVVQHLVANDGNTKPSLFRAAITSSHYAPPQYLYNDTIPEALYSNVVSLSNCSSAIDTLACLREADTDTLQTANIKLTFDAYFGTTIFLPVIDGTFIRQRPSSVIKKGNLNAKYLLSVVNSNEGEIFINQTTAEYLTTAQYISDLFPHLPKDESKRGASFYQMMSSMAEQFIQVYSDVTFVCPTIYLVENAKGARFKGEFAISPGLHGNDVPYYFPSNAVTPPLKEAGFYNNSDFIKAFSKPFLAFATSLDPNTKISGDTIMPVWGQWNNDSKFEMVFNKTEDDVPSVHSTTTDPELLARCRFWESVGNYIGQ